MNTHNNKNYIFFIVFISFVFIMFSSCARSPQYERDQSYNSESNSRGSSSGVGSSSVQQVVVDDTIKDLEPKKRVYVVGFINETNLGGDKVQEFFDEDGKLKLQHAVSRGRALGIQVLVLGKIKKIVFRNNEDAVGVLRKNKSVAFVTLNIAIVDIQSGKEIFNEDRVGDSSTNSYLFFESSTRDYAEIRTELIQEALRNIVKNSITVMRRTLDKVSWEGRVAKILAGRIYINAGRNTGLNIGDILKVLTDGQDIYDPDSGSYIGRAEGQVKGTLEILEFIGGDGAVCKIHSGGNFTENDVVQLY